MKKKLTGEEFELLHRLSNYSEPFSLQDIHSDAEKRDDSIDTLNLTINGLLQKKLLDIVQLKTEEKWGNYFSVPDQVKLFFDNKENLKSGSSQDPFIEVEDYVTDDNEVGMSLNTISVTAYLVSGSSINILDNVSPNNAIEEYLCPDMRPPVQTILIEARTDDGKLVKLYISPNTISGTVL